MTSRIATIAIDAEDPRRVASFWCDVLGWVLYDDEDEEDVVSIGPPAGTGTGQGLTIDVVRVTEPKTVKNRLHLDVRAGDEGCESAVARLVAMGATELWRASQGPYSWVTLADPEGNEFCVS